MKYTLVILFVLLAAGASATTTTLDLDKLSSISFVNFGDAYPNIHVGAHICLKTKEDSQRHCTKNTRSQFQCFGNGCSETFALPANVFCRQSFLSSNMDCYGRYDEGAFNLNAFYDYRELPDPRFDFNAFIACEQDLDIPTVKVDTCHILLIPLLKHSHDTEIAPFVYSDLVLIPVNYYPHSCSKIDFNA
jgi:hypothetical protein